MMGQLHARYLPIFLPSDFDQYNSRHNISILDKTFRIRVLHLSLEGRRLGARIRLELLLGKFLLLLVVMCSVVPEERSRRL